MAVAVAAAVAAAAAGGGGGGGGGGVSAVVKLPVDSLVPLALDATSLKKYFVPA